MRLKLAQVKKAMELREQGQSMQQLAHRFHVHETTMRKVMRNYERYGASLWSMYPTDVAEDARP